MRTIIRLNILPSDALHSNAFPNIYTKADYRCDVFDVGYYMNIGILYDNRLFGLPEDEQKRSPWPNCFFNNGIALDEYEDDYQNEHQAT